MAQLKSILSWMIVAVMLLATAASVVWANHTIDLTSLWTVNNGASLSVNQGSAAELFVFVTSTSNFGLWVQVLQGNIVVQNVVGEGGLFVPSNINSQYYQEFPVNTNALAGDYTVVVTVLNGEGTENEVLNLHVETTPIVNPVPDQDINEGQTLQFTAAGSDQDGDAVTFVARKVCAQGNWLCSLAESFVPSTENHVYSGMSFNQQTGQFSYSPNFATVKHPATEREFPLKIRAYDDSGQFSAWEYVTVTVNDVNQLPQFTSTPATAAEENAYYVYPLTATDGDSEDELTFSLVAGPEGMLITPNNVLRWTPTFEQAGDHAVTLQVSDGSATVPQSFTITVQNTNRAPELNPIGNKQGSEGQLLQFTVTASDPDGDQFSLSTTNLPFWATFNQATGQFSWTPTFEQAGSYQITFRALDTAGDFDLETITITVVGVNRAPVVVPVEDQSVDESDILTFTVSATDEDGDALTFAMNPGWPAGATLTNNWDGTATFSWTPSFAQAGTYALTFSVADSSTLVQETFTVTVRDVTQPTANQAPVLDPVGNRQVDEGQALVIVVSAADPDGDTLTFSTGTLPAGATFNAATRTFSWTPGFAQAGLYAVSFLVSDGSLSDTELVWITVNDVVVLPGNQAPVLAAVGDRSVDESELLQFTVTASDPDGDALMFSTQNLPPGASFDLVTGQFSWTPGLDQAGSYPGITFTVTDGTLSDSETITVTVIDVPAPPTPGCTDPAATNYNPNATQDDGSCVYPPQPKSGCTDSNATNFNPDATEDDGSCVYPPVNQAPLITSFTLPPQLTVGQAGQFTVTATDADGDILSYAWTFGDGQASALEDPTHAYAAAGQYAVSLTVSDGQASVTQSGTVTVVPAVVPGCTDATASNFNPQATQNNGSCQYPILAKTVAISTVQLPEVSTAGDYLSVNVVAKNSGEEQLKNLQVTVMVYDLNTFGTSSKFTLNPGKSTNKLVYVPLPYDAWPGSYLVKITVDNGVARDSTYRQVWVQ